VFGVPFEVIPFKANKGGSPPPKVKRYHVHALPNRRHLEIQFPRVEGYRQAIRNRITLDWKKVPPLVLKPDQIPPEVQMKGLHVSNTGKLSLRGPGKLSDVSLKEFRAQHRMQELVFDLARAITKHYLAQQHCTVPPHVLFPQLAAIVERYIRDEVAVQPPADRKDLFLAPYYGWLVETLLEAIRPDTTQGEAPEVPRYESSRGPGSTADVDFWTSREVREVTKSHVNYIVADTRRWEQSAAYFIDTHPAVESFVKNAGLGFAIPYLYNGQMHDYVPDFIVRLAGTPARFMIVETKGYDPLLDVKRAAAERWVAAVNADGRSGVWSYRLATTVNQVRAQLDAVTTGVSAGSVTATPA
jgi:type III restriction enzyme